MKKRVVSAFIALAMAAGAIPAMAAPSADYATREYVVSEFVQSVGRNNLTGTNYVLSTFKDADDVSGEYTSDIAKAVTEGLLHGYEDKTIKPKENVKRIEALAILSRCLDKTPDKSTSGGVVYDENGEGHSFTTDENGEETAVGEPIEFTDVPEWAKEDIDKLSSQGIVKGYGDGRLGADDNITVEQVKLLTDRTDEVFNTGDVHDSFYGYANNKLFRNAQLGSINYIDAKHGAIMSASDAWSHWSDIMTSLNTKEDELLEKLMNDELTYEEGSPEQRIHDMLLCIANNGEPTESDKELIKGYRDKIMNASSVSELIKASNEIYCETGVNPVIVISSDLDPETNYFCPSVSLNNVANGSLIKFSPTAQKLVSNFYKAAIERYIKECGMDITEKDVAKAIELQETAGKNVNYFSQYQQGSLLRQMMDPKVEGIDEELELIKKAHPDMDFDDEFAQESTVYTLEEADKMFDSFNISDILADAGYTNMYKIIFADSLSEKEIKDILSDKNLTALKINALIALGSGFECNLSDAESRYYQAIDAAALTAIMGISTDEPMDLADLDTEAEISEGFEELSDDGDILSAVNLYKIKELLPNDIGMMYCNYYYDDKTSETIADMTDDIWTAYIEIFADNTWMSEKTKEEALAKITNMVAVIGYPDNYDFPTIVSAEKGGTYIGNFINIKKDALNTNVRLCADREFGREIMFFSPDTVNACYIPNLNIMNIYAGILNAPFYDPDASYAANLGSMGAIIGHEIGHAFDVSGSQYDEVGRHRNWWTEEDSKTYAELTQKFVDYYANFDVLDGVVQDSTTTIGENMADFAGISAVMKIIGDDKEAQKEALMAYANLWARLGTESYLNVAFLGDPHSSANVRCDAIVASLDCFYEIFDIQEGDAIYIAPEDRLKLW